MEIAQFVGARETYTDYRIPAMVISDTGDIYIAFECREDASDWANIDLCIMKSTDGGESFREIRKIPGNGKTMNNPVLLWENDKLHFVYCVEYREVYHIVSPDGGNSWTEPQSLTHVFDDMAHTVVATGPGHGVVTADGVMVMPVWLAYDPEDIHAHRPSFVTTLYSCDGGKTWNHGQQLEEAELIHANETAIACLQDGSVLLNIRNRHPDKRMRYLAVSRNGYDDWDYLGMTPYLPDPWCMGSMCNGAGKLFFCNCASEQGRKDLTLRVLGDDLMPVESIKLCDIAGYSEIAYWDGKIYVLYETYLQGEERRYDHKLHLKTVEWKGVI